MSFDANHHLSYEYVGEGAQTLLIDILLLVVSVDSSGPRYQHASVPGTESATEGAAIGR